MTPLWVFLGGGLGSLARWSLDATWQRLGVTHPLAAFPAGILLCNLIGCFLIGLWTGWALARPQLAGWTPFFSVGFLGGFTTFSSFAKSTLELVAQGHAGLALLKIGLSVIGGLAAAYLGLRLASPVAL